MHDMKELKARLERELESYAKEDRLQLDTVHKLTDTIKNLCKISMYKQAEDEYSERGSSYGGGSYDGGSYDGGSSYARRGQRYVRGYYRASHPDDEYSMARGGGRNYSRADAKNDMMSKLGMMLEDASSNKEREALERCMRQIENS